MNNQAIQPSADSRATALAIAASLYDYPPDGSPTSAEKEAAATRKVKLIAAAAKELCAAVKSR